jgi:hypothetical protein
MERNRVKGHNRVAKGKNGFKVIRVDDFFRKKDENRGKKLALGAGLVVGATIGSALLLKGKGAKNLLTPKTNQVAKVVQESKKVPVATSTPPKLTPKKEFSRIEDPWETPILTKIQKESQLVTGSSEGSRLLSAAKPKQRDLLRKPQRKTKGVEDKVIQVSNAQKDYKSLPVEMQTILQVEKALLSPTKVSKLGRPPERTSIVKLVDGSGEKLDKATRKVKDRLQREKSISDEAVKKN